MLQIYLDLLLDQPFMAVQGRQMALLCRIYLQQNQQNDYKTTLVCW